jgi:hypothetical protein
MKKEFFTIIFSFFTKKQSNNIQKLVKFLIDGGAGFSDFHFKKIFQCLKSFINKIQNSFFILNHFQVLKNSLNMKNIS